MGRRPSTAKPLKGCGNGFLKGNDCEIAASKTFHQAGIPVLVSPKILRSRHLGQCDLVRFLPRKHIEICEIKSCGQQYLSGKQRQRLMNAARWLSQLFGHSCLIIDDWFAKKPTLP